MAEERMEETQGNKGKIFEILKEEPTQEKEHEIKK